MAAQSVDEIARDVITRQAPAISHHDRAVAAYKEFRRKAPDGDIPSFILEYWSARLRIARQQDEGLLSSEQADLAIEAQLAAVNERLKNDAAAARARRDAVRARADEEAARAEFERAARRDAMAVEMFRVGQEILRSANPPPYYPPKPPTVNCTSQTIDGRTYTTCR